MSEYRLSTLRDIFEKVPTDRIEDCMQELTTLLLQSKAMGELLAGVAGVEADGPVFLWPAEVVWKDDGKREVGINFHAGLEDEPFMMVRTQPSSRSERDQMK